MQSFPLTSSCKINTCLGWVFFIHYYKVSRREKKNFLQRNLKKNRPVSSLLLYHRQAIPMPSNLLIPDAKQIGQKCLKRIEGDTQWRSGCCIAPVRRWSRCAVIHNPENERYDRPVAHLREQTAGSTRERPSSITAESINWLSSGFNNYLAATNIVPEDEAIWVSYLFSILFT